MTEPARPLILTDADADASAFRPCVGMMLLNAQGRAWVGRRRVTGREAPGAYRWQMPQGGIDPDEDPASAALRELTEEIGTDRVEILAEHPDWLAYRFPPGITLAGKRTQYRGQRQKWFALRFVGSEAEFNLAAHEPPEFDDWRWVAPAELPALIVPFKRPVYEAVVEAFAPLARRIAESPTP